MKTLELNRMEILNGGLTNQQQALGGLACGLSLIWPIGTAIAGPTCLGLIIKELQDLIHLKRIAKTENDERITNN